MHKATSKTKTSTIEEISWITIAKVKYELVKMEHNKEPDPRRNDESS